MANVKGKKEVSCKFVILLVNALKVHNIPLEVLFEGVPYDHSYLLNKHERIEWHYWGRMLSNLKPYFSTKGFETLGADFVKDKGFTQGLIVSFVMYSSSKLARLLTKPLNNFVKDAISCVPYRQKWLDENNTRITGLVDEGYETIPEFFMTCKGTFEQYGIFAGVKNVKVDLTLLECGAVCDITWEKSPGLFGRFTRILKLLINIKKTFYEQSDSYSILLEKYQKLDESKAVLQKQATNLKTAYEITKSIQQIRDIKTTLNSITSILIKDTEIASAGIKLMKDTDGNTLELESFSGDNISTKPLCQNILINNEILGELEVQPKLEADISELEKLMNYILPVIDISIYNSLVLRTITDYKNNLESKVGERTSELKAAQEELSKTISLLKEAQQNQNRFFTNISHEFRTPLTLILGPAEQIIELSKNEKNKENARIIFRSAKKLKRLANQLLDLARLGTNSMKLETRLQNLITVLWEIVSSFFSMAESKKIILKFIPHSETIMIYLDRDKLEKIMNNLISNALKFTPSGGEVIIEAFEIDTEVGISVADTGIGIPENELNKVFDRFYQVDNRLYKEFEGTGVGLSLTKELVELHKGKIIAESEEGKGSTFKIILTLGKEHLKPDEIAEETMSGKESCSGIGKEEFQYEESALVQDDHKPDVEGLLDTQPPLLLIVEDNPDVRNYISDIMRKEYKIVEAVNGEEGLSKSFELMPEIIISDVMMPKMDGFQLCNRIKSDSRTSHIPIILLTAKATLNDKVEGFESGADSYIMKPFDAAELRARIKNLLQQRQRLHEYFRAHGLIEVEENGITPVDQKFLQNAASIINEHISDPSFDVEKFAEKLAVSRSLLHKKLTALTGESPGELIKRFRLNKAAKMLELKSGNITEIAFQVGFNDASYFTLCFRRQFGMSPSQYHKNNS